MSIKQILATACLSAVLSACGSSSSGGTPQTPTTDGDQTTTDGQPDTDNETDTDNGTDNGTDTASDTPINTDNVLNSNGRIGIMNLEQIGNDRVFGNAFFSNFSAGFNPNLLTDRFNEVADTCEVASTEEDPDDPTSGLESVSAGETVTFSSNASGTYATFTRFTTSEGDIVYSPSTELAAPQPLDLVLDIPGDNFPTFTNVAFPAVAPLDITPTDPQVVNANTQFQWATSGQTLAAVEIDVTFSSQDGVLLDIFCVARDDGNFSFPENIKNQIGNLQTNSVFYGRTTFRVVQQANDYLWLINYWEDSSL